MPTQLRGDRASVGQRSRGRQKAERPARSTPVVVPAPPYAIESHARMALLSAASLLLMSLIFAPIGLWPIAFVCLIPWLILCGVSIHAPRVYFHSYVFALAFFLLNMRWLYFATGWGYLALSVYQAAYFPLIACVARHVIRRRRWPLAVAFPVVWTGSEMVRAVVLSGFPWFYLSHSLHGVLPLIQVSDLVGAYGVSFLVAGVNGAAADAILVRLSKGSEPQRLGPRRARLGAAFVGAIAAAALTYGVFRLTTSRATVGPKVAVIQGDFISSVDPDDVSEPEKMETYLSMIDAAEAHKPDLFLLPETPWTMFLNPQEREVHPLYRRSFAELQDRAKRYGAYLVTGSASRVRTPNDLVAPERRYNSATIFSPDGAEPQRYDKVHVVPFGETVPFRVGRLRFLYFWLNAIMPFSDGGRFEYSIFPGEAFHRLTMSAPSREGAAYRFAIPICYEDVMPYVSRKFVSGGSKDKQVDFLLNISNDGWFGRGIQQPQHLAICQFRAVENRVGIARAVNTGISAFIDPTGRVHDAVRGGTWNGRAGNFGYAVANLAIDSSMTFYSRHGDWFAWGCAVLWLVLFVDYWVTRARTRETGHRPAAAT